MISVTLTSVRLGVHLVLGIAIVRLGVVLALLGMRGVVGLRNDGGG